MKNSFKSFRTIVVVVVLGVMAMPGISEAGLTAFLKIEDIPGESLREGHEDEIDFTGLSWRIERAESDGDSTRTRAQPKVGPVKIRKLIDKSSPYLALATLNGRTFPEMVIAVRKDSGDAHLDYLVITLTNVRVTLYEMETGEQANQPTEEVGFAFEEITYKYIEQREDNSAGDEHEIQYNIVAGS